MNILFTICGRAGSKGFKNKNLKKLNGIPLVNYTLGVIKQYKENNPDDNVMVALNTDSLELKELVKNQVLIENVICVDRKDDLAGDIAPKVAVIQDTYMQLKEKYAIDVVVDLDITSPMRRLCDVEGAISNLKKNPEYDLVFSVVPARRSPYFNMVEIQEGYYRKICKSNYTARQQAPKSYELNASIYAYRPQFLDDIIDKTILDYKCGIVEMPDYLVLDIDSEEDFEMMEILLKHFMKSDTQLLAMCNTVMQ